MGAFKLRIARVADADAVTAVLTSAYSALLTEDSEQAVLAAALPAMTVANHALLASGTYYVQEGPHGQVVSCGGWTYEEPGSNMIEDGIAHVRHFGTHADWIRQGLAKSIFERCRYEALLAGIHTFKCFSIPAAESFYLSMGFRTIKRIELAVGGAGKFPAIMMIWTHHQ